MDTVERLNQMKLFEALSDEDRIRWGGKFRRESHLRGNVVIRQDERGTAFYIVDQGELRALIRMDGREMPCAYFFPGDYFGETALLTGEPRNATIDVLADAELLVLDKLDFDQLMSEFPDIRDTLRVIGRQRETAGRIRFPWQRENEVTVFFSTKHWIALLRKLPLTFLTGVLGLLASTLYLSFSVNELSALLSFVLMLIGGTFLALAVFFTVYHFFDWRNDHYIITSLRVLHVERVLLLREDRDEASIERIQDIQANQEGFLANVLNFGDVVIQTAAATEQIVFADVPRPDYVRDALFAPREHTRTQARAEERESIRQELSRRLNIPLKSLKDPVAPQVDVESTSSAEGKAEEKADFSVEFLALLRSGWKWLRDAFTFETWIESEGGKTVTWRKNGWLLFGVSLPPFFAAIFVMGLALLFLVRGIGAPTLSLLLLLLLVPILGWWFYLYWDWQNDIYQISGNRLIDLKRRPLFLQEIRRETTLDRVENIALSIPGPVAQLLNYGTVLIETAGETGAFEFEYVHDPRRVQQEIFDRMEGFKQQERDARLRDRHAEMAEWFEVYEDLKRQGATESSQGSDEGWG